ncbi:SDR family oxidoreductase [Skermanella pratensis]|uniref:SDR family oxidoreductase n=1 Tax=Skermanella pratensis TaxID=2233999 RepID=UPI0013012A6A|nr:SDR family oxidoreductase [Skermanella pratensis]
MRLANKIAIVTGAGSGFGEGIARTFAREGASVVVNDLDEERGRRVADSISSAREGAAVFFKADVTDDGAVKAMVEAAGERFGGLDIMVNNAGYTHRNKPMLEVTEAEFDRIYAVNVKALFLAARHVVPALERRGGGVILTTASTAGLRPRPGLTWYNSSKGAAIVATKSMAVELAPLKIRVNALCPVIGDTGMIQDFMGEDTPERRRQFTATIPLGRMSRPDDIANAALYLVSDEAEFITGVALEVDGGRCI